MRVQETPVREPRDDIDEDGIGATSNDPQPWMWAGDGYVKRCADPWAEEPDGGFWYWYPRPQYDKPST